MHLHLIMQWHIQTYPTNIYELLMSSRNSVQNAKITFRCAEKKSSKIKNQAVRPPSVC